MPRSGFAIFHGNNYEGNFLQDNKIVLEYDPKTLSFDIDQTKRRSGINIFSGDHESVTTTAVIEKTDIGTRIFTEFGEIPKFFHSNSSENIKLDVKNSLVIFYAST